METSVITFFECAFLTLPILIILMMLISWLLQYSGMWLPTQQKRFATLVKTLDQIILDTIIAFLLTGIVMAAVTFVYRFGILD